MAEYLVQTTGITKKDIRHAVLIHRKEIGQGFLSSLGSRALDLIFSNAADSKSGILLIARERPGGSVCGFLLGTLNTGSFYKEFLLRKSIPAIITLLPHIFSLSKIRMILETLLYPSKIEIKNLPDAELLDIAVSHEHQGKGIAQLLFQEFAENLQKKYVQEFKITTGEGLLQAQRFYEKLGAQKVGVIKIHKERKTIVYKYEIQG